MAGSVEDTVEVSHEALVRHWSHLKSWVDADRQFLVWQQRLNVMRTEWEAGQRSPDLLLRGLPLREAMDWLTKKSEYFSPDERLFITASMNRRTSGRLALATIAGFVCIVIGMTVWLWGYSRDQAMLKVRSLFVSIHLAPDMRAVAAGRFRQGDTQGRGQADEKHVHEVKITSFAMGKFEVTFDEYDRFALATGRPFPGDQGWRRSLRPVINVSWDEAKAYAEWLSKETGKRYRLPSESEWEYAARSEGKDDLWAGTSDEEQLKRYAVYAVNSQNRTAPVGEDQGRKPNTIGLYDMSGNVYEWVEDCAHKTYERAPMDGSAWLEVDSGDCGGRVIRGGSWFTNPDYLRASARTWTYADYRNNSLGFRLAQDLEP